MKIFKVITFFALLFIANTTSAQSTFEKWPSIKTFHEVISQTFHPAEEGNLEPIKLRSEEIVQKATALSAATIPTEFKTEAMLESIKKLQLKTKSLHEMILAKTTDAAITKTLNEVHDIFHEIVGLCSEK